MRRWREHFELARLGFLVVILGLCSWLGWNCLAAIAMVPAFLFSLLVFSVALSLHLENREIHQDGNTIKG